METELRLSQELITAYDYSLITSRDPIRAYFENKTPGACQQLALNLIRYASETRLQWSPTELRDFLTKDILDLLHLTFTLPYIQFPEGMSSDRDLYYIAWCIYPSTRNKNLEDIELRPYIDFINHRLYKLPREYFTGLDGIRRACNALNYVVETFHPFESMEQYYAFFSSSRGRKFIAKYRLTHICRDTFDTVLDFAHTALPENLRDEALYHYYWFLQTRQLLVSPKYSALIRTENQ